MTRPISVKLIDMTWPMVEGLSRDVPVVLPIAALEQHSRHLPVFTDSILCGEIVRRAEVALADQVLFAPVMWLGNSEHHMDFSGTVSASPRAYLDMLRDMVGCFLRRGFRRVVLVNGHGGNTVPGQQALFEIRQNFRERSDLLLLLANYWSLGTWKPDAIAGLTQPSIMHACQWETSMMLHLRPELVGDLSGIEAVDYGNPFLPAFRSSTIRDISPEGHVGDPAPATAAIGEALLTLFTADVIAFLRRVIAWDGRTWHG